MCANRQLPQSETNGVELQEFENNVEGGHPSKEDDQYEYINYKNMFILHI